MTDDVFDKTFSKKVLCDQDVEWYGCYSNDAKYKKYLSAETNAHPAKMGLGLCDRIFKHLEYLGFLNPDSVVIDYMSGTGRTAVLANLHGYKAITVELESHFIKMEEQNKEILRRQLQREPKYLCDQHYRIYVDRIYEQLIEMNKVWQRQIEVLESMGVGNMND
jgi:DNA modification methylase